jgi:hypothetical protein
LTSAAAPVCVPRLNPFWIARMALFRSPGPSLDEALRPLTEKCELLARQIAVLEAKSKDVTNQLSQIQARTETLDLADAAAREHTDGLAVRLSARLDAIDQSVGAQAKDLRARLDAIGTEIGRLTGVVDGLSAQSVAMPAAPMPIGELLVEAEGLQVFRRAGSSEGTVVAVSVKPPGLARFQPGLIELLAHLQCQVLLFTSTTSDGFSIPIATAAANALRDRNMLPSVGPVVGLGIGPAAYAALLLDAALGARATVAFSPGPGPAGVFTVAPSGAHRYILFDPRSSEDRDRTLALIAEASARAVLMPFAGPGAGPAQMLAETQTVGALLTQAAAGAPAETIRRLARGARAGSPTYWRGVVAALRPVAPRWSQARQNALERVYHLRPDDIDATIAVAESLVEAGHQTDAAPLLDAIWAKAGQTAFLPALWRLFMVAGQFGRARDVAWEMVQGRPNEPLARVQLARSLMRLSQPEAANAQLEIAREYAGNNRNILAQIRQVADRLARVETVGAAARPA